MYAIELSEVGKHAYSERDKNLEQMVLFLVETMGPDVWPIRKAAIVERLRAKLEPAELAPPEGISIRDREDEIGWYLHLCEQTIADPPSVDSDQASRVLPYFSALGRKLDILRTIPGIQSRIVNLLKQESQRDPDQGIFELLVGVAYASEGWSVIALPENPGTKTPDYQIDRTGQRYLVECKRLTRRPEYTDKERDAWMRLWGPARDWLIEHRISKVWTVLLHEEIHTYPVDFLLTVVRDYVTSKKLAATVVDNERCKVSVEDVDYIAIDRALKDHYVKLNSSREREVITGRHNPDYGLTSSISGRPVAVGPGTTRSSWYWEEIGFVSAAYWRCDAPKALNSKARDIMKRLAEATEQLSEHVPGIVHIGLETADGDDVELVRSEKIVQTIDGFDPRGKKLAWVFLHFFRGESPPDEAWAIDETTKRFGGPLAFCPLKTGMLLGDDNVPTYQRAHWEAPRGRTK